MCQQDNTRFTVEVEMCPRVKLFFQKYHTIRVCCFLYHPPYTLLKLFQQLPMILLIFLCRNSLSCLTRHLLNHNLFCQDCNKLRLLLWGNHILNLHDPIQSSILFLFVVFVVDFTQCSSYLVIRYNVISFPSVGCIFAQPLELQAPPRPPLEPHFDILNAEFDITFSLNILCYSGLSDLTGSITFPFKNIFGSRCNTFQIH